jgi:hypothetical protein
MNQGFMIVAELTMCHVSEDLAPPVPAEGYMVSFVVLHEQGFGVPLHRFLRSLLQHYHQELHNLTPLWILHIAAFLSLCEAYLRWTPHLGPWNYFFHARHLQDPDVKLTISGGRGDSRQVMPWHQSLFLHPSAQIDEGVVKEVVLL